MDQKTVEEIYSENDEIRQRLHLIVGTLDDEQAMLPTENGKWTIQGMVEHLATVEAGMTSIISRLLDKAEAEGMTSDGTVTISDNFAAGISEFAEKKLEAPDVVVPGGEQKIGESLGLLKRSREKLNALKTKLKTVEGTQLTFPHPAFGNLSAQDWLVLIGGHELRHVRQIEKILSNQNG